MKPTKVKSPSNDTGLKTKQKIRKKKSKKLKLSMNHNLPGSQINVYTKDVALEEKIQKPKGAQLHQRVKMLPPVRQSDEPNQKKILWTNRERILMLASRGVSYRGRHIMKDMIRMMPHSKVDTKLDTKQNFSIINEIADVKNATKVMFLEARKKADLYLWLACPPNGPSAKFLLENIHTTAELKLTGNCIKSSRPLLSFSPEFDSSAHWVLIKEMLTQIFGVPNHHPLSQPFVDKVFTFTIMDNRVWFRNYQIGEENAALSEIGPRFSLNLIKMFSGSFGGPVLYENPKYISPNDVRRLLLQKKATKYTDKLHFKQLHAKRDFSNKYEVDETDEVFHMSD